MKRQSIIIAENMNTPKDIAIPLSTSSVLGLIGSAGAFGGISSLGWGGSQVKRLKRLCERDISG